VLDPVSVAGRLGGFVIGGGGHVKGVARARAGFKGRRRSRPFAGNLGR
jgi:hypothetical protein